GLLLPREPVDAAVRSRRRAEGPLDPGQRRCRVRGVPRDGDAGGAAHGLGAATSASARTGDGGDRDRERGSEEPGGAPHGQPSRPGPPSPVTIAFPPAPHASNPPP